MPSSVAKSVGVEPVASMAPVPDSRSASTYGTVIATRIGVTAEKLPGVVMLRVSLCTAVFTVRSKLSSALTATR